jgi:hypothetical protein
MRPFSVVVHFDTLKDFPFCFFPRLENISMYQFDFQGVEKNFSYSVILTIALFAHITDKLMLSQQSLKIITAYWLPLSEWQISPLDGLRRNIACFKAC